MQTATNPNTVGVPQTVRPTWKSLVIIIVCFAAMILVLLAMRADLKNNERLEQSLKALDIAPPEVKKKSLEHDAYIFGCFANIHRWLQFENDKLIGEGLLVVEHDCSAHATIGARVGIGTIQPIPKVVIIPSDDKQ